MIAYLPGRKAQSILPHSSHRGYVEPSPDLLEEEKPTLIAEKEVIEDQWTDAGSGLKPNFLKFVVVTDQSVPVNRFLPGCDAKPPLDQQKDAVRLYSGNSVYSQMNKALRDDEMTGLKKYGSLINLTMQPFSFGAMQQPGSFLKPFVGTVWRGLNLPSADQKLYYAGNVVVWTGFSSTTKTSTKAFAGNCKFEIHCNKCLATSKDVLSAASELFIPAQIDHVSDFPKEDEVLYPPYTKFRVVNRIQKGSEILVVMETMEFPCLNLLVKHGQWDKVKEGLAARITPGSPPWFTQHQEHEGSFISKVAEKVVSEGATSDGLAVIAELQGLGANPQKAHEKLKMMDKHVPLPESHAKWYFDAGLMNPDDKQLAERIHQEGSTTWQEYFARQATKLEAWFLDGQKGNVEFTVINNTNKEVPYVVWKDATGHMYQKAIGGGMIGNHRRVRRG